MDVDEDNEGNQISFDPEGFLPSVEKMIGNSRVNIFLNF